MSLRESVGNLGSTLLSVFGTRLELFSLEAQEQKSQWLAALLLAFAGAALAMLALLVFSITLALLFWPTDHRYLALFLMALVYAMASVAAFLVLRQRLRAAPAPFSATIDELRRDMQLVQRLKDPPQKPESGDAP